MTPEYLYKYGKITEFSEQVFSSNSIWLAAAASFNDPFECTPNFVVNHDHNQIMDQLERALRYKYPDLPQTNITSEAAAIYLKGKHRDPEIWQGLFDNLIHTYRHKVGLYCLTEKNDSILMWSHYSAEHRGYCLEFETTNLTPVFGRAQQVNYADFYPEIDFYNTPDTTKIELAFLTKFTDWDYEKEWRIIDHSNVQYVRKYPSELLKSVTFGAKMSNSDKLKIKRWLAKRQTPVQLYQAILGKNRFEILFQSIE